MFSNFSTAALIFATVMAMMFIGRIPVLYLLSVMLAGIALIIVIYFTADLMPKSIGRVHTMKGRIERFVKGDPNSETGITQADYAKLAIYEGGLIGKGPGHSDVRNYMAAAYSDFIFSILVEEYGLVVGVAVILLYLIFFYRCIIIVRKSERTFPAFLVAGLGISLLFQTLMNVGVSSGVLPVTGQPLPWISLGGTALLFTSVSFGMVLGVSYQSQLNQSIEKQPIEINAPDEDYVIGK
jgi:cell division protein FtsW